MDKTKVNFFENRFLTGVKCPFDPDASREYKNFSTNIKNLLEQQPKRLTGSVIISLEATYGMGKTTLIDMWGTYLNSSTFDKKDTIAIKYNAWEEDHSNEPFYSFISSLIYQLNFLYKDDDPKKNILKKFSKEAYNLKSFLFNSLIDLHPTARKIADNLNGSKKEKTEFDIMFEKEENLRSSINNFKETLKELVTTTQLFIFIDEIDRCKPTFSVELLERIKHLFDVHNVFFIIATTSGALQQNVSKFYGYDNNLAKEYLERFFDFQFNIPTISFEKYIEHLVETKGDYTLKKNMLEKTNVYISNTGGSDYKNLVGTSYPDFLQTKDILKKMIENCQQIYEQEEKQNLKLTFQKLSFRLLNKLFSDVLIFNQFYITLPPEMYGLALALILSHRLSIDKKNFEKNSKTLIGSIKLIESKESEADTTPINDLLTDIFDNVDKSNKNEMINKVKLHLSPSNPIKGAFTPNKKYIQDENLRFFLSNYIIPYLNKNLCPYESIKLNIVNQIKRTASIQSS